MSEPSIRLAEREHDLPTGRTVRVKFFANAERLLHTVKDHVLSESEPWFRLLGVGFLKSLRKKIDMDCVSSIEAEAALAELYAELVEVLDQGILFSIEYPVYVEYSQERRPLSWGTQYATQGLYCISRDGVFISIRDGVLRTAQFVAGIRGASLSKQKLFAEAWRYVKKSVAKKVYRDSKGQEDVEYMSVLMVSPENWATCPTL